MPLEETSQGLAADLCRCCGWPPDGSPSKIVEEASARTLAFVLWLDQGIIAAAGQRSGAVFQQVFTFLNSNDAAVLRHRFGTVESLCVECAQDFAETLVGRIPAAPPATLLATAIASAWNALDGNLSRPTAPNLPSMDPTMLSALLLGTGTVAAFVAGWQKFGASKEFRDLAQRHGGASWARQLLRNGRALAERTGWSLRDAWDNAIRRRALSGEEIAAAIHALGNDPNGRRFSCVAGVPFDPRTMEAGGGNVRPQYTATMRREGLEWQGEVLARAEVDAGTADYVAVTLGMGDGEREKLLATAGGNPAGLRLTKAVLQDALDRIRTPAGRDEWLRRLAAHWPGNEVRLILPESGEAFDEWIMVSADELSAPRLALVAEREYCGLRRTNGDEVLVRSLVTTRLRPEAARRI